MKRLLLVAFVSFVAFGCERKSVQSLDDDAPVSQYDEDEMRRAISTAKSSVDAFIKVLESNGAEEFFVKVPIKEDGETEHFWIDAVIYRDGSFFGRISNKPGVVKNVELGQPWEVKKDDISDWMYYSGDKIYGGFTIDPLLPTFPEERAKIFRSKLVR